MSHPLSVTRPSARVSPRQSGVVLIIALIMMVAMTLTGIVLFRQSGTGIVIARNLTFKQGATIASDRGVEAGIRYVAAPPGSLDNAAVSSASGSESGYFPGWCHNIVRGSIPDSNGDGNPDDCAPTGSAALPSSFDAYSYNWANSFYAIKSTDTGSNGYEVRYVIHRLCSMVGGLGATGQKCVLQRTTIPNPNKGSNSGPPLQATQVYYRVTTKVTGPFNTVSYTEADFY